MRAWKKLLTALIIVLGVLATVSSSDSGSENTTEGETTAGEAKDAPKEAGLNQPARDGKFEFIVKGVDCSRTQVGDDTFGTKAQGKFCFVGINVKNIGDEAQSLFGDNQYLYDAAGKKYSADTEAAIYVESSETLYEEINPGNQLDGTVIFDVPAAVEPVKIELHDSAFSAGVTVNLK